MKTFWLSLWFLSHCCFAEIRVTDYLNREVVLAKPATRIIALAPHIVENIFTAGAGQYLVGAVDYCDYPEQAKQIPRVGAISTFSIEAILDLKPDLVVVWHSGRGGEILGQLEKLKIPTYASDPRALSDIPRSIRDYGKLTGTQTVSEKNALAFEQKLQSLAKQFSNRPKVSVFYQVWHDPLQTVNGEHIISDVIQLCGGENIFSAESVLAPRISMESVLQRNPKMIIVSGTTETDNVWKQNWQRLETIDAVKNNALFAINGDLIERHTVRILQGAEQICAQVDTVRKD